MTRPNLIWVFGDQHRAQSLSLAGDPNLNTPNIDRLAHESGMCFRGVAGHPLCCPFRGSLLTSRYPHQCVPGHGYPLPENMPTVAHAFREGGYHTAWFGKWHLGGRNGAGVRPNLYTVPHALRGGFDTWIGYENNSRYWDCHVHGHRSEAVGGEAEEIRRFGLDGYETDVVTDLFMDHLCRRADIAEREDAPFFAALSVLPPHGPYVAPSQWMQRHNPARVELRPNVPPGGRIERKARIDLAGYHAAIENLDYNLGRILDTLRRLGLLDNTHILFFSDHGDMHGSHGRFLKVQPFAESVDVPMILGGRTSRWNGRIDSLINHVDIAPTSLGLCGIDVPEWMHGTDYSPRRLIGASDGEPDSAYLQSVVPTGHVHGADRPWRGVLTRDGWKYVCLEHQPWLMFDLNDDPYEMANLALDRRFVSRRRELHDRLRAWIADTADEFPLPEL